MKHLNIVSSAYRATIEEQDDTVVWVTHCLRNAGADIDMLLCGAAVNYPLAGQEVAPVTIGGRAQKHGPDVHEQIGTFLGNGSRVLVVRDDLDERGIDHRELLQQVEIVDRAALPSLLMEYDNVWHW